LRARVSCRRICSVCRRAGRFAAELERGDVYVALDGERIVGAVRTKPQEKDLYIDQIAVDPPQQGTGVGSWLCAD